jgi:hypothetical protein
MVKIFSHLKIHFLRKTLRFCYSHSLAFMRFKGELVLGVVLEDCRYPYERCDWLPKFLGRGLVKTQLPLAHNKLPFPVTREFMTELTTLLWSNLTLFGTKYALTIVLFLFDMGKHVFITLNMCGSSS